MWVSPLHLMGVHAKLCSHSVPGILADPMEAASDLLTIAAKAAFYGLPATHLKKIAQELKALPEGKPGLFEYLQACMEKVLCPGLTKAQVAELMKQRITVSDLMAELIASEEGADLLEIDKTKADTDFREELLRGQEQERSFAACVVSHCRSLAQANSNAHASGAASSSSGSSRARFPVKGPGPDADLLEPDAQAFFPPGARVWLDNIGKRWQWAKGSRRRKSAAWNKYGYRGSLFEVLKDAWQDAQLVDGINPPWTMSELEQMLCGSGEVAAQNVGAVHAVMGSWEKAMSSRAQTSIGLCA